MVDYVTEEDKPKREKSSPVVKTVKEVIVKVPTEVIETKNEEVTQKENREDNLSSMTVADLKIMAKEKEIKGYSTMKKDELIKALK
ncbi:MAG: Rho termination factor N-terminal domain-containing protein [Bacilli bacterium]